MQWYRPPRLRLVSAFHGNRPLLSDTEERSNIAPTPSPVGDQIEYTRNMLRRDKTTDDPESVTPSTGFINDF
jgi:hypothetical protein